MTLGHMHRKLLPMMGAIVSIACVAGACAQENQSEHDAELHSAPVHRVVVGPATSNELRELSRHWGGRLDMVSGVAATNEEVARVRACLHDQFILYPQQVLAGKVERVLVAETLESHGSGIGGTYGARGVFIATTDGESRRESCSRLRSVFHHEISSILLHEYRDRFPKAEWLRLNPDGFEYRRVDSNHAEDRLASTATDARFLVRGFVAEYSTISFEEDFNMLAAMMMSEPTDAAAFGASYPRLRDKLVLVGRFYRDLGIDTPELNLVESAPAEPVHGEK